MFDVGRARPNDHYLYGQPLAVIPQEENIPIDTTRWGVVDFRPLVHDSIRFGLKKSTSVHDHNNCMNFLAQAMEHYNIREGEGSTLMVIDTFIDDVYNACVYRSQENVEFYGTWRNIMNQIEYTSFMRNFRDYISGELYDIFDVKRVNPTDNEFIVDTIHPHYGGGNIYQKLKTNVLVTGS